LSHQDEFRLFFVYNFDLFHLQLLLFIASFFLLIENFSVLLVAEV